MVWLLVTQKPINRPAWWKGTFALFQMLATGTGEGGGHLSKGQFPPSPPLTVGGESFYRQTGGRVYMQKQHSHL